VLEGATGDAGADLDGAVAEARSLVAGGARKREAASQAARRFGAAANEVYRALLDG
jgi:hypothetical protein